MRAERKSPVPGVEPSSPSEDAKEHTLGSIISPQSSAAESIPTIGSADPPATSNTSSVASTPPSGDLAGGCLEAPPRVSGSAPSPPTGPLSSPPRPWTSYLLPGTLEQLKSLAKLVGQELVPELDPLAGLPVLEQDVLRAHAKKFSEVWESVHHLVADLLMHYERHGGPPLDGRASTWLRRAAAGAMILRS